MKRGTAAVLVFLAGCGGSATKAEESGSDPTGGSSTTTTESGGTSGTDTATGCLDSLPAGLYDLAGSCVDMSMAAFLTPDESECSFTLDSWTMMVTGLTVPTGGTVVGDQVTLEGPTWGDCTGTLAFEVISGTCPSNGCTFTLVRR